MFKSVLTIIFVVVVLLLVRAVMQRFKLESNKTSSVSNNSNQDTVQCLQCKTYIPNEDAIFRGDKAFCSTQHLHDWKQNN
ncbi:MAG: PP0621 family protein [Gammaproteobacteria bacterium]|nr:PP0621 family protein [Gammaproteobacteria bacterium]